MKDIHVPFEGIFRNFIIRLSIIFCFEGAGDALWVGKQKLFCGIGPRTDVRALTLISEKLKDNEVPFKVYGYRLIDPRSFY